MRARGSGWILTFCILFGCGGETAQPSPDESTVSDEVRPDAPSANPKSDRQTVVFLGDSLSAGYGLNDSADAFPSLIQKKIDELGWKFEVVNAGVSGDTTAGGLRRIDWLLKRPIDVLILELGGNDGLRGVALDETRRNLQGIIDRARAKYPDVSIVVAGMMIPPNLGPEYTGDFNSIFPELARRNDAALIPFLLDGVGGRPDLNQPDGIHPTEEGHRIVADLVWNYLKPVLERRLGAGANSGLSHSDSRPLPSGNSTREPLKRIDSGVFAS